MTLPERFDIVIDQGSTFELWFAAVDPYDDSEVWDLAAAGYTIGRLQVRVSPASPVLVELTTSNGRIVIAKQWDSGVENPHRREWSGYLRIPAITTAALTPWGRARYKFEIENGDGVVKTLMRGDAYFREDVTL